MSGNKDDKAIIITGEPIEKSVKEPVREAVSETESLSAEDVATVVKSDVKVDETSANEALDAADEVSEEEKEKRQKAIESEKKADEQIDKIERAILDQAQEGEKRGSSNFTFTKIMAGDILSAQVLRNNIWIFVLVVFFMIVYVTNRYTAQKYMIEIDKLNTELEDAKYRALASSSQLTEKTRESHILELLQNNKDSVLKISDRPPYIINVPE